jgi:sugar phosphate isomerase/epimerase
MEPNSMIRSSVTISLVNEARGGPFVFWDDLAAACDTASQLKFDAIEIFAPGPEVLRSNETASLLKSHELQLAAVGTGAGWVKHQLHLTLPDRADRQRAIDFIKAMIEAGAINQAPAIIGSMQGRWSKEVNPDSAIAFLIDALNELGEYALQFGVPLIFEPLNRYETNIIRTVEEGLALLDRLDTKNVSLLADLFHMNIEEADISAAIRQAGNKIGHVHFVDSNRRPAGEGHIDFGPIALALNETGYIGFASAEALPWPDSQKAAATTITTFQRYFPR